MGPGWLDTGFHFYRQRRNSSSSCQQKSCELRGRGLYTVCRKSEIFCSNFSYSHQRCSSIFAATYAVTYDTAPAWTVETSKDTTNGVDGTWTTQYLTNQTPMSVVKPNYRISSNLITLQDNSSSRDLRGIRVTSDYSYSGSSVLRLKAFQIYGEPANSATPDRLDFRSELTDAKLTPYFFDWGNVPRSSSEDRSFRIKNLSATLTATDIDLYVEALTPGCLQ